MAQSEPENGLGKAIAVQRVHLGMKRKDLADASALSYPYISEIENGAKQPSTKALRKIADALRLSVADLHARAEDYADSEPMSPGPAVKPASAPLEGFTAFAQSVDPPLPSYLAPTAGARDESREQPEVADVASGVRKAVRRELDAWAREELPELVRRELQRALAEMAVPRDVPS